MRSILRQVLLSGARGALPGQTTLTAASGTWVVPAGVTSICVCAIGAGAGASADATTIYAGDGGGLEYKNSISVTPGETLDYNVNGSYSRLMRAGVALCGASSGSNGRLPFSTVGAIGYAGGNRATATVVSTLDASGGEAARFTQNGADGNIAGSGAGVGGMGFSPITGLQTANGLGYGGGQGNQSNNGGRGVADPGVLRIIWGSGRSFPSTAIGDV